MWSASMKRSQSRKGAATRAAPTTWRPSCGHSSKWMAPPYALSGDGSPRPRPPKGVRRDLILLGVAWKVQEQAYGGLGAATNGVLPNSRRPWSGTATSPAVALPGSGLGARLVREWRGETHTVIVGRRRVRMAGPSLAVAVGDRPRDHRGSLVRPALLRARRERQTPAPETTPRRLAMRKAKNGTTVGPQGADPLRDLHPQVLRGGLEQEFNSLDAQREACEAYILQPEARGLGGACRAV